MFPELGLSGYSIEDLLHQHALTGGCSTRSSGSLPRAPRSSRCSSSALRSAPSSGLFNAAVVIHRGRVLGAVPKTYLPEYREFYEKRHFRSARDARAGRAAAARRDGAVRLAARVRVHGPSLARRTCRDLRGPVGTDPSVELRRAGRRDGARQPVGQQRHRRQGRLPAPVVRVAVGEDDRGVGVRISRARRVDDRPRLGRTVADLRERRAAGGVRAVLGGRATGASPTSTSTGSCSDRVTTSSFGDSIHDHRRTLARFRRVEFELGLGGEPVPLRREIERFPYVPADPASRNERCEEVYSIQVQGLETRLRATGIERVVIGVSGGLDSAHALIVAARAIDRLRLPRANVLGYTMPGFATSQLTLTNARSLMDALGVTANELDIRPAATQMLRDLGHPAASGEAVYDVTYENVQAGRAHLAPVPARQPSPRAGRSAPATSRSWRSAGARTASATRCRTTTSTHRCRRR